MNLMNKVFVSVLKTRQDIDPMLIGGWSTVYDAGPTSNQKWINVLRLLVRLSLPRAVRGEERAARGPAKN